MEIILTAKGLGFFYEGGPALFKDLAFCLSKGSLLTILGANGTGKSTLLDILAGLKEPTEGTVEIEGGADLRRFSRLLPQNIDYFLLGQTVSEEIMLSVREMEGALERAMELASMWGFAGRLEDLVETLSVGEKKRLALLGVLSGLPGLLLLDEPFSGLDWNGSLLLSKDLNLLKERGETVVLVTHEPGLVKDITDYWLLLSREHGCFLTDSNDLAGARFPEYGVRPF